MTDAMLGRRLGAGTSIARTRFSASFRCATSRRLARPCTRRTHPLITNIDSISSTPSASALYNSLLGCSCVTFGESSKIAGWQKPKGGYRALPPPHLAQDTPKAKSLGPQWISAGHTLCCFHPRQQILIGTAAACSRRGEACDERGALQYRAAAAGACLEDVKVALVALAKGVLAAGEAVEDDEAEGEDVHALALAHVPAAAANQLLRRLPPCAATYNGRHGAVSDVGNSYALARRFLLANCRSQQVSRVNKQQRGVADNQAAGVNSVRQATAEVGQGCGLAWAAALKGGLVDGEALAEAHVGQLGVAALREQDVLRLNVPMHNAPLVQRHQAVPSFLHHLSTHTFCHVSG